MAHRDILAKLSSNHFYVVNPNPELPWRFSKKHSRETRLPVLKHRPNLVPRFSSKAEIELVTSTRPGFKLPPVADKAVKSFVLSSPSASFNRLLVDENLFADSPVVI